MYRHWSVVVVFRFSQLPHPNPNTNLKSNSVGLHFQESRVVLNDSAFKNGWDIDFSKIFRHKQGSNEQKTEKKDRKNRKNRKKKHIFQYLNGAIFQNNHSLGATCWQRAQNSSSFLHRRFTIRVCVISERTLC